MTVINPPITGHPQTDSWALQVTQQVNQGLGPGLGGAVGGVAGSTIGGGGGGNSPLFLYTRTTETTPVPNRPTTVTYNLRDRPIVSAADNGWTSTIPDESEGNYLWVTLRYLTAPQGTITDFNTWNLPEILSISESLDNQGRIVFGNTVIGYEHRYLDTAYATDDTGTNFAKSIEDLPVDSTVVFQGIINTATTGISNNPALFLWRQVPVMGRVGVPAGITTGVMNQDTTANFFVRSWDYDPATFTVTLHTNRADVNFNTIGGLPNPSMTIQFNRAGDVTSSSPFFTAILTLIEGAQEDGADDLTFVVPTANRNAWGAAGNQIAFQHSSPARLLAGQGGLFRITPFPGTDQRVNVFEGNGAGAHYRSVGRRNIDWVFSDVTPANFNNDPTDVVIDLDDLIAQVEGLEGAPGAAGTNAGVINLWQVTTTMDPNGDGTPLAGPTGTFTYDFSTSTLSGGNLGAWSLTVPTVPQGSFLWITTATASATQLVDLIESTEFSTPAITSAAGLDGLNQHIVELYQVSDNNETAPSDPTGDFTYTFSTDTLIANVSANFNGWSQALPEVTQGTFLWVIQATASSRTDTDIINGTEFSAAVVTSSSGAATAVVPLYITTTTDDTTVTGIPPVLPSGDFTYSFTNHTLTGANPQANFNSWSQTLPNVPQGSFLWITQAVASSITNTDTINGSEFSAPVITSSSGLDGSAVAIVELYQTTTSNDTSLLGVPPNDPTGTFTYTYATNLLSGGNLNGWSQSVPDVPQGSYLWLIQAAAISRTTTDTIASSEFSAPVIVSSGGGTGDELRIIYINSEMFPATPDPSEQAPDGWSFTNTAPTGNERTYISTGVRTGGTGNYTWSFPTLASGSPGGRGAGRWNYRVDTTLAVTYTQADLDGFLASAVPGSDFDAPVLGDQLWLFASPSPTNLDPTDQRVFIYSTTAPDTNQWVLQNEVIDGNLLVSGTITGSKIVTRSLDADEVLAGNIGANLIDLDGPMIMDADNSAIIAGRSVDSVNEIDGLFFGRAPGNGFQLSGIASSGNVTQGLILDNTDGFRLYAPTFYIPLEGSTTPGFSTYTTTGSRTLERGRVHRIVVLGAGGGGGGGGDDNNDNASSGTQGGSTVIVISGTPSDNGTYTAQGGTGGAGGLAGDRGAARAQAGTAGQSSFAGDGGAGGISGGAAGAPGALGAGGGGSAGANDTSFGRRSGEGGLGGNAGQETEINIDLTAAANDATINVTSIGVGGIGGIENNGSTQTARAGSGGSGAVYVSNAFANYFAFSSEDLITRNPYQLKEAATTPLNFQFNSATHYGPFTTRRIIVGTMNGNNNENIQGWARADQANRRFRFDMPGVNDSRQVSASDSGVQGDYYRTGNLPTTFGQRWGGTVGSQGWGWGNQTLPFRLIMDPGITLASNNSGRTWTVYDADIFDDVPENIFGVAFNQGSLG